jgi:1,2-dihydroxy-3-keto-5-methylthiopentene dioxygenase
MATLWFRAQQQLVTEPAQVAAALEKTGVYYERWGTERMPANLSNRSLSDAEKKAVLAAFAPDIARRSQLCGYQSADVVTLYPDTPNLDVMLAKFDKKHIHTDDEVRFVVQGRGVFTLFPEGGEVIDAELHPGDFITVPKDYKHHFVLCADRQITAIRLFTDAAGWVAHYVP